MALPKTVDWQGDALTGRMVIIEQTKLPHKLELLELTELDPTIEAIARLAVRGAPALGVAGAYGAVLALRTGQGNAGLDRLANARPTAVNLGWAVDRVSRAAEGDPERALIEAKAIHADDVRTCRAIGEHGAALIEEGFGVLTHCNARALATGGMGTALAPMYVAHEQGRKFRVFADETRPLLQGARLTSFELSENGVDVTVIADPMSPVVMREGKLNLVITGADRVARNGDAANKIGTYGVALHARTHGLPFYIAAPKSTFDANLESGAGIPIEERNPDELRLLGDSQTAPPGVKVYNPAFDVTPAELIAGYITEDGILNSDELADWLK
ncbi:MAG: S-methyl-5-thioribose-1-phosphate isomerase [Planctomycetes bacterium]|nr:S-methyl-5-thioribose-1-phosphate isomerase [Planctomycetota bacterium]